MTRKLADRRFEPIGLTRAQWLALVYLDRRGPMTQSALAELIEIETATVARLIDRLEASGWVERGPGPDDRRVKLVSMTDKAQCIMEEVASIGQRLREDMLADLPDSTSATCSSPRLIDRQIPFATLAGDPMTHAPIERTARPRR